MKKPYVIIHTLTSLDGRIHNIELPEFDSAALQYEQLALHADQQVLNIQGYLNGRVSTDDNFTHDRQPDLNPSADTVPEGDFVAEAHAPMYYVALDPTGRLGWQENHVDYGGVRSHVVSVLTEKASNAYKDLLRRLGISYVIAGRDAPDNALALHKLATLFGMERVMIGGGGVLNWSYVRDGLVDEVSLLLAPVSDASPSAPGLFTAKEPLTRIAPQSFTLIDAKPLKDSTVWLRYRVNNPQP
ncbi:TPA: RibD family protein [Stenotrophomonas maltophilia]|nr:RibD family protein [Stenotrophomonas geniculata]MBN4999245.1 RibD family protein [Stenotrophomonas maltophilia]MBN5007786.1 RibD family protein [Stenotrophomonas maltophilia]HEL7629148.1 RibD family protein [Stenotrophomonas maltophilia]